MPPTSRTTRRPTRTAAASPSSTNGTPASEGREPRTNVISGCTDATVAPRLRKTANASLVRAPLECNTTLPFQSTVPASDRAAQAISASGIQNQISSARDSDRSVKARAPTCFANFWAFFSDSPPERTITASIVYRARCRARARAVPKFPAPTIATRGLAAMPGSIAETAFRFRDPAAGSRTPRSGSLYIVPMTKSSRKSASNRNKERLVSSRTVYRGPVFWVTTDDVEEPGGVRARRDVIHHSGSVVVLAVDDSGATPRVLLERQYRHAATDYLWELPAGRIDPGEQELKAAQRELLEETGYTAAKWRRIPKFYASPGFVAETMSVYLATGLHAGKAQPEADEVIYKRLVPLPTAVRMVTSGTIRDGKTISGVLWLQHRI